MNKMIKASLVGLLLLGIGVFISSNEPVTKEPTTKEPIKDVYENLPLEEDLVTNVVIPDSKVDKVTKNEEEIQYADTIIHFIDSGQSDSMLIENNGHFALIDAGDRDDDELMVRYLKEQGVEKLDYVILSHYHSDHIGGADAVIKAFDVKQAYIPNGDADTQVYRDLVLALSDKGVASSVPLENKLFKLGDATLEFFNTKSVDDGNENNNSLVVLLESNGKRALFTGDAEAKIERTLTNIGKVDLFKAGHHGSETSNTQDFLNQINPEKVVVQVGEGNKHNHPSASVMQRFESMGIDVYRTDEQGDVIVTLSHDEILVNQSPASYASPEDDEVVEKEPEQLPDVDVSQEVENFKNCTELREKYPDGVSSEHPAYQLKMDRDKDNWACER